MIEDAASSAGCRERRRSAPAGTWHDRTAGPLQAGHTSPASGPAAAVRRVRRFRFVIEDAFRRETSTRRREAVADYVGQWSHARIVGESQHGRETIVRVELLHPVPVAMAEEFVRDCPHYVRDTFAGLGS